MFHFKITFHLNMTHLKILILLNWKVQDNYIIARFW